MEEVKITTYPEGYEKAKSLLNHIPEDKRNAYITGFVSVIQLG